VTLIVRGRMGDQRRPWIDVGFPEHAKNPENREKMGGGYFELGPVEETPKNGGEDQKIEREGKSKKR